MSSVSPDSSHELINRKSSEERVMKLIKCCCLRFHFQLMRVETSQTALFNIEFPGNIGIPKLLFQRTFVGLHREEIHPTPPSRGQGRNMSRGGAHVLTLTAENKKKEMLKKFAFSNIQDTVQEASGHISYISLVPPAGHLGQ